MCKFCKWYRKHFKIKIPKIVPNESGPSANHKFTHLCRGDFVILAFNYSHPIVICNRYNWNGERTTQTGCSWPHSVVWEFFGNSRPHSTEKHATLVSIQHHTRLFGKAEITLNGTNNLDIYFETLCCTLSSLSSLDHEEILFISRPSTHRLPIRSRIARKCFMSFAQVFPEKLTRS